MLSLLSQVVCLHDNAKLSALNQHRLDPSQTHKRTHRSAAKKISPLAKDASKYKMPPFIKRQNIKARRRKLKRRRARAKKGRGELGDDGRMVTKKERREPGMRVVQVHSGKTFSITLERKLI